MANQKTCCFTGHRPQKLPFVLNEHDARCIKLKQLLRNEVEKLITEAGVTHFISGMSLGIDIYAAEIVLELKEKYPHITLEAALACETQCERWTQKQKSRYYNILAVCDIKTVIAKKYTEHCMLNRSKYLVNRSDVVVAIWDGNLRGTLKTVQHALNKKKAIICIYP